MSLHTLTAPRAPRAAFGKIVLNEARLAWRSARRDRRRHRAFPWLLLVIFGSIPVFQQPSARLGGLARFEVYIPILIAFSIGMLALARPARARWSRTGSRASCAACRPRRCPPFWVLAAQVVVQACLMLIAVFMLIGVSVAVLRGHRAGEPGRPRAGARAGDRRVVRDRPVDRGGGPDLGRRPRHQAGWRFYPLMFFSGLYVPDADPAARVRGHQPLHPARRGRASDPGLDARAVPARRCRCWCWRRTRSLFGFLAKRFFRWE